MEKSIRLSRGLFAAVFIALGILGLMHGDYALVWQMVPKQMPGREAIAYLVAALELLIGLGLLFRATLTLSCRVLFPFMLLWLLVCRVPGVVTAPGVEASWLGFGETSVIVAGAWVLFATHAGAWESGHLGFAVGPEGVRWARYLFAVSLPMIGLSHFVYMEQTAQFVPAWMPFRAAWPAITGAGDILAGVAVFFAVLPRLAATLNAAMLGIITLGVWLPGIFDPSDRLHWTAFVISSAIAGGAWLVADSYGELPWLAGRKLASSRPRRTDPKIGRPGRD